MGLLYGHTLKAAAKHALAQAVDAAAGEIIEYGVEENSDG
jgi:hypothetical protein